MIQNAKQARELAAANTEDWTKEILRCCLELIDEMAEKGRSTVTLEAPLGVHKFVVASLSDLGFKAKSNHRSYPMVGNPATVTVSWE